MGAQQLCRGLMLRILIRNLDVPTVIGVYPHERGHTQNLKIDLDLEAETSLCMVTDHLGDTVDYDAVCEHCKSFGSTHSFQLVERFAHALATELMQRFRLRFLSLVLQKDVPSLRPARVAVKFEMHREDLRPSRRMATHDEAYED
jgi:7,8-dihydroneopterin aldolase/epimerase/oxygenase